MSKFLVSKWNTERKIKFTVQQHNAYIKISKIIRTLQKAFDLFCTYYALHSQQQLTLLPTDYDKGGLSGWSRLALHWTQGLFSLASFFFSSFSFTHFKKSSQILEYTASLLLTWIYPQCVSSVPTAGWAVTVTFMVLLFEPYPPPGCQQCHLSCEFTCMSIKGQFATFSKAYRTCQGRRVPLIFPLYLSFQWITRR